MHVPDEGRPLLGEGAPERGIAAIKAIKAHPSQADALVPSMADQRQRQVGLAPETPLGHGDTRRLTARRVVRPRLGQK